MGLNHTIRKECFTASQISRLTNSTKAGKPLASFMSYVEEKAAEIMMDRVGGVELDTHATKYGSLMECILADHLTEAEAEIGNEFNVRQNQNEPVKHPTVNYLSGTPDFEYIGEKQSEIKCYYPKKFALLSMCLLKKDVELLKANFASEYWQTVCNSIILGYDKAELIAFMPSKTELEQIIETIESTMYLEQKGLSPFYDFMSIDNIEKLPYLPETAKLESINRFEFTIPEADKKHLIERVELAGVELEKLIKQ